MSLELKKLAKMNLVGDALIKEISRLLLTLDKQDTGQLIRSLDYDLLEKSNEYILQLKANAYFNVVDKGRKPNSKQPPISAIEPWVIRKGIYIGKDSKSAAFVIAKSIGKKGIKPTNVLQRAIDNTMESITQIIGKSANKEIKEEVFNILNSDRIKLN